MGTGLERMDAPLVTPVRTGNIFEETMEALLQAIRLGQFAPGSKLPSERDLAQTLRVSRTTLREVLAHLSKNGFVTIRRGRYGGTYVAQPPPPLRDQRVSDLDHREVADLLTLRRVVEPAAAELAAQRGLSSAQADQLSAAHSQCSAGKSSQFRPLDSRLHLMIAELSGSPRLRAVVAETRDGVNALLDCIPLLPPNLEHSAAQHEAIVKAIIDSEPDTARQAMLNHIDGTAALLRGFLG